MICMMVYKRWCNICTYLQFKKWVRSILFDVRENFGKIIYKFIQLCQNRIIISKEQLMDCCLHEQTLLTSKFTKQFLCILYYVLH